jgi:hypothetical protein
MSDIFDHLDDPLPEAEVVAQHDMRGQLTSAADAWRFLRAGKAIVTLVSKKTGARFTYRLNQSEDAQAIFVGLLNGPSNTSDYKYLGRVARDVFWLGRKVPKPGDISRDAPSARAFDWMWKNLAKGNLPEQLEIWHEGQCGRCGRRLTVPESVAKGFGPECAGKMGL